MLFLLVLPVSIIFAYLAYNDQKDNYLQTMKSHAITNIQTTIMLLSKDLIVDDYSQIIENMLKVLKSSPNIDYLYTQKRDENVILYATGKKWEMLEKLPKQLENTNKESNDFSLIKIKQDGKNITVYHAVMPILISGYKWGWLHAGFYTDEYQSSINSLIWQVFTFLTIALVIAYFIGLFLGELISKPISDLTKLTKMVSSGNLTVKSEIEGSKEVNILSHNFNKMIKQVSEARESLNETNIQLENRVKERTSELENLNETLDQRIKEEVQQRHKQEDMLIHQSRLAAMGEMIGNIAHQWRQPLNALGLTIQNIQTAYENNYLNEDYINRTIQKSRRLTAQMSRTIDDFRDFFQPEQHKENFNLKKCILHSVEIVEASFRNYAINIEILVDENISINGYSSQFSQVILNILNNAKDALIENREQNRQITIATNENDDIIELFIEDNGGGIKEEIVDKIFDPYYTTKEQGKGTGIGLYMSKMIIEKNMQGVLSISNVEDGAKFDIKIYKENRGV